MKTPKASTLNALRTMRSTKPADTGPERRFRAALRAANLRGYRLNMVGLPGRPDVAFTRHKLAVFVHGCFWHLCPHCKPATPKRNARFWKAKLEGNVQRDERKRSELERRGWTVMEVWECQLERDAHRCASRVTSWLSRRRVAAADVR